MQLSQKTSMMQKEMSIEQPSDLKAAMEAKGLTIDAELLAECQSVRMTARPVGRCLRDMSAVLPHMPSVRSRPFVSRSLLHSALREEPGGCEGGARQGHLDGCAQEGCGGQVLWL